MGSVDIPFAAYDILTQRHRDVVHFPETTGAAKTRQLHYYTMRGERERDKERNTERGNGNLPLQIRAFWWSAKNRKRGLANVSMLSAYSQLFIAHLAMAEDLRSTPHWSWIRSRAGRGEVRKYADFNDEIFVRIRTMVLASFAGSTRERHAKSTWCIRDATISRVHRERIQFGELLKTIHFRTKFISTLEIHVQTTFTFGLNNWSTRQLIYCRYQSRVKLSRVY